MSNNNNNNDTAKLILGLAAAGAAFYFFTSDKGQQMTHEALEALKENSEELMNSEVVSENMNALVTPSTNNGSAVSGISSFIKSPVGKLVVTTVGSYLGKKLLK